MLQEARNFEWTPTLAQEARKAEVVRVVRFLFMSSLFFQSTSTALRYVGMAVCLLAAIAVIVIYVQLDRGAQLAAAASAVAAATANGAEPTRGEDGKDSAGPGGVGGIGDATAATSLLAGSVPSNDALSYSARGGGEV